MNDDLNIAGASTSDSSDVRGDKVGVLLLDEQEIVRRGLRLLIEGQSDFNIVGEAGNRSDALDLARREQPDIIIIDMDLAESIGISIIAELLEAAANARIILLVNMREFKSNCNTIFLGARGLVFKQEAPEVLIKAIKKAYSGGIWMSVSTNDALHLRPFATYGKGNTDAEKIATLTRREREVVTVVAAGLKNRQIAEKLLISEATVSHHLTSIFNKLGISDRSQLVAYAYRNSLTDRSG